MTHDTYVDGAWKASHTRDRVDVINPATEERVGSVPAGAAEDVDAAVAAAHRALDDWARRDPADRARLVTRLADELERSQDELTDLVVAEVGTPRRVARWAQVGFGILDLRSAVDGARQITWEQPVGNSLVLREPAGVVGCITPWNYPLHQITAKIGAALCAGCTVVVKPSEVAPLTALALARAVHEVGFPPGVFNLVNGYGTRVGEALAAHPDVDMVSFTGSNAVGRRVLALASGTVKKVALELGGKSASVVLDDADLERAAAFTVRSCFLNAGQSCNSQTRMLVPRGLLRETEALVTRAVAAYVPGDPLDESTRIGPLVSHVQREHVLEYIRQGMGGARLVTGGPQPPAGLPRGYYVKPTVFSDVPPGLPIAQEEIFGPVLSMIPYDSQDEAVALANGTVYGIAGAVWSEDRDRALATARRLAAAQVEVNGGRFNPAVPFGGYKQSGLGREGGVYGVEEFLQLKSLQL
ncbi:aldehyde dehydrogenase family protein [Streptomyces sp. GD-15H]|uniref:aldehyde dehydrogenase family protein n=1 Tax=Streptomyces sp. GD-15H TaxID=3129112 RepID=UPI00325475C8